MSWSNEIDKPVGRDEKPFESFITHEDQKAMSEYRQRLTEQTVTMTGLEIKARLNRIDAELARLDAAKLHLIRLKDITKAAILSTTEPEQKDYR